MNTGNIFFRKVLIIFLLFSLFLTARTGCRPVTAQGLADTEEEIRPSELYARSAVLMDAETGRVLFAKNGSDAAPMASTTKIVTCILALEYGEPDTVVTVSERAAAQPEVRLGMREGQTFLLKDLLYSLMLESHNDTAVAVAECIGGSEAGFAGMMNEKAEQLGCEDTYFITPNGLDAQDGTGFHHTTAEDLALLMRYCIMDSDKREEFLEITGTPSYTFSDCEGSSEYSCRNHNAFLNMMEGALSGKTGFTSEAGYCYVGALRRDERTFIVALLACGWPNNKGYKWKDTEKLMRYAMENYQYEWIGPEYTAETIPVRNGYVSGYPGTGAVDLKIQMSGEPVRILMKKGETAERENEVPDFLEAPVEEGALLGEIHCRISGSEVAAFRIYAGANAAERNVRVCFEYIIDLFLLQNNKILK